MSEHGSDKEKHPTASGATEPEEEFIEQKARPSEDVSEVDEEAPPKEPAER